MSQYGVESLNERAEALGYAVVGSAEPEFKVNMGQGPWVRLLRNGQPCHKFPWRGEEIALWLRAREKEVE